ncbi:hypothetical protein Q6326_32055, partial [Klebsiella pneumoniae]|nr:hypothetical protein [Klebsiella pneumoniae]
VTTENGEVFLMGLVTEREAKAAADIASRVMALKKYSTPSTFYAFAASGNACRMRRKRLIRPTVLPLRRPDKTRQRRI